MFLTPCALGTGFFTNIVVGFDGSEHSKAALAEIASWLKLYGGKALLVYAVFFDEEEYGTIPDQLKKRMDVGKKMCVQAEEDISSSLGISIESLICEGDPADTIIEIAETKNADLIAIGTHGRKGIKKLVMGSVTSAIVGDSPMRCAGCQEVSPVKRSAVWVDTGCV